MSDIILKMVGKRIRDIRKQKGLTQEQLGELCGFHYSYLGAVERAEKNISLLNVQKIADSLQVPVFELFAYEKHTTRVINVREEILNDINMQLISLKTQDLKKVKLFLTEILK